MKTKEELAALKAEVEALDRKLGQLTAEELEQVTGGIDPLVYPGSGRKALDQVMGQLDVGKKEFGLELGQNYSTTVTGYSQGGSMAMASSRDARPLDDRDVFKDTVDRPAFEDFFGGSALLDPKG